MIKKTMSSVVEGISQSIERNVYYVQQVLTAIVLLLTVAIFGLGVSLIINTVVTQNDLLLGTVVSDSDRSKIKTITGLSLTIIVLQIISGLVRYRFH